MPVSSDCPSCEETFARLNLETPPVSWCRGWAESQRFLPEAIPFLEERHVVDTCDRIRIPEDQKTALVRALRFFEDEPLWKRVVWHQHQRLFGDGKLPPDPITCLPFPEPSGEPASLYLALLYLSGVPGVFAYHASRGIPETVTVDTLSDLGVRIRGFRSGRGYYGLGRYDWMGHHFAGRFLRLGRLQYEMIYFKYACQAYRNRNTGRVLLLSESGSHFRSDGRHATVQGGEPRDVWVTELAEDDRTIRGTVISPYGRAVRDAVTLDKAEWALILRKGDPVWDLHIPAGGRMDFDECGESLRWAAASLPEYFPGFPFRAFTCHSWFLDPQLEQYLDDSSNIVRLIKEIHLLPVARASDWGMMNRLFGGKVDDIASAPRDTSLRRAVLTHIERGGHWYDGALVLFPEDLDWGAQVYRRDFDGADIPR